MEGGRYVHFDWMEYLTTYLNILPRVLSIIHLDFHIDGVDITNDHSLGLWTIICKKFCKNFTFLTVIRIISQHIMCNFSNVLRQTLFLTVVTDMTENRSHFYIFGSSESDKMKKHKFL